MKGSDVVGLRNRIRSFRANREQASAQRTARIILGPGANRAEVNRAARGIEENRRASRGRGRR